MARLPTRDTSAASAQPGGPARLPIAEFLGVSPRWQDPALAAALALIELLIQGGLLGMPPWWVSTYLTAGFVPLVWRRRRPTAIFVLIWLHLLGAAAIAVATHSPGLRLPTLNLLVAIYTVAAERPLERSAPAAVLGFAARGPLAARMLAHGTTTPVIIGQWVSVLTLFGFIIAVSWVLGRWVQFNRNRLDSVEERRRRAVAAERRRMARELHDVVSHSVSVMVLQAAGARRVLDADPARARLALAQIEGLGKESMAELRRLLGVLRDGAFVEDDAAGELRGRPGLAGLAGLLDGFRGGGLTIRSELVGHSVDLDGSVDLSAYRIIQEALTNAGKHAGPGTVAVIRQVWADDLLLLEVTDDGRGTPSEDDLSTEHGLVGLRERARAVGGHLEAGPLPGGGFRVSATLPVRHQVGADQARTSERAS
jgi:signal transduction histidine kinase